MDRPRRNSKRLRHARTWLTDPSSSCTRRAPRIALDEARCELAGLARVSSTPPLSSLSLIYLQAGERRKVRRCYIFLSSARKRKTAVFVCMCVCSLESRDLHTPCRYWTNQSAVWHGPASPASGVEMGRTGVSPCTAFFSSSSPPQIRANNIAAVSWRFFLFPVRAADYLPFFICFAFLCRFLGDCSGGSCVSDCSVSCARYTVRLYLPYILLYIQTYLLCTYIRTFRIQPISPHMHKLTIGRDMFGVLRRQISYAAQLHVPTPCQQSSQSRNRVVLPRSGTVCTPWIGTVRRARYANRQISRPRNQHRPAPQPGLARPEELQARGPLRNSVIRQLATPLLTGWRPSVAAETWFDDLSPEIFPMQPLDALAMSLAYHHIVVVPRYRPSLLPPVSADGMTASFVVHAAVAFPRVWKSSCWSQSGSRRPSPRGEAAMRSTALAGWSLWSWAVPSTCYAMEVIAERHGGLVICPTGT